MNEKRLTHLQQLEAESIHILREVAAEFANPVMLYSIGKDSSVMLHLARKAFYPGKLPFPLLHVDTGWKFREMYEFRDKTAKNYGFELLVYRNPEGEALGINPFIHGSAKHTDIMKTEGLKQALDKYGFDAAFGGQGVMKKNHAQKREYTLSETVHTVGILKTNALNYGITIMGKLIKVRAFASSHYPTGQNWIFGNIST